MKHLEILPSILSFDFKNINNELKRMKDNGITYLHYDVMDGHFVSNISFSGAKTVKVTSKKTDKKTGKITPSKILNIHKEETLDTYEKAR